MPNKTPLIRGSVYCRFQGEDAPSRTPSAWLDCGVHEPYVRMSMSIHKSASPAALLALAKGTPITVHYGYNSKGRKQIVRWEF